MSERVVIDPVTRIEGHLKIEVEIDNGIVTDAWSSGTLFRGVETILQGREPEEAWLLTQRICGVCTYIHGVTSVRSVENALNITVPENARIVRNLLTGGLYVHDHPVHFYHLSALDWVDIVSALSADPVATEALAYALSPNAPVIDFADTQASLQSFVNSGKLGPFAGGYWGHSAYTLSPEENLLFAAHYLYALRQQVSAGKMHAIFGGKNPHIQSLRVGGVTCGEEINSNRIDEFRTLLTDMRNFIDTVYSPDVRHLATAYPEWGRLGGFNNYLTFGEFQTNGTDPDELFMPCGVIMDKNIDQVEDVIIDQISEHVEHSWYEGTTARYPENGETAPNYTGYDTTDRYSWLKAPRYNGLPMEVGPLARIMVGYGIGHKQIVPAVDEFLGATGLTIEDMHSTLGRSAARAIETKLIADSMDNWLDQLQPGASSYESSTMPQQAYGLGLSEAPRGALGHWINVEEQKIGNYQMVVPSTWNLGPRCSSGARGPVEEALIGTPVADSEKPIEILRIVHSFDPCMACAVHVTDNDQDRHYTVKAV
jgi:[NiFe] hydrogenase large subunit